MSWGPITATDTAASVEDALEAAAADYAARLPETGYEIKPEATEQIAGAIAAAVSTISVVAPNQPVSITLSGHANPDHTPDPGWANDFVIINVSNAAQVGP